MAKHSNRAAPSGKAAGKKSNSNNNNGKVRKNNGGNKRTKSVSKEKLANVFSVTEEEESADKMKRKYGHMDIYEYDMPDNIEDEEIDESEAFDEADELKYGHMMNKKGKDEESEELEDDFEDESDEGGTFMDLSEMLNNEDEDDDILRSSKKGKKYNDGEDDDDDNDNAYEDDDDEAKHSKLMSAFGVEGPDSEINAKNKKKREEREEQTEIYEENEYKLSAAGTKSGKLELDDLMGALEGSATFGTLKKQLEQIKNDKVDTAVLLNKRAKKRMDRGAAYKETTDSISSWNAVVKKNREAVSLSFPMNESLAPEPTSAGLVSKFKAETDLEIAVADALEEDGLIDDGKALEAQQLSMIAVDEQEAKERKKELLKTRALLSYYEQKRARINKIKSKNYHRHLKSQKKKQLELAGGGEAVEEAEKKERARAEERMTLRHKNTSKWAQHMLKRRNHLDQGTQTAIADQIRLGESLRQKITMEDEEGSSDESEYSDSNDELNSKHRKIEELNEEIEQDVPMKGLFAMKFMQKAMAKKKNEAVRELEKLKHDIEMEDEDEDNDDFSNVDWDSNKNVDVDINESALADKHTSMSLKVSGPVTIGGSDSSAMQVIKGGKNTISPDVEKISEDGSESHSSSSEEENGDASTTTSNPWLAPHEDAFENEEKDEEKQEEEETENNKKKAKAKSTSKQQVKVISTTANDDDDEDSSSKNKKKSESKTPTTKGKQETKTKHNGKRSKNESDSSNSDEDDDDDDDDDNDDTINGAKKRMKVSSVNEEVDEEADFNLTSVSSTQRQLIERAFANDNVAEEFEAEKAALEDLGKPAAPVVLPGWGSWGGDGVPQRKKKVAKPEPEKKVQSTRKDRNLKHVILNEARDKKAAAKLIKHVPHSYTDRAQYERATRNPIGKEWNTPKTLQSNLQAKISVKKGKIVAPMGMTASVKKLKEQKMNKQRQRPKTSI